MYYKNLIIILMMISLT